MGKKVGNKRSKLNKPSTNNKQFPISQMDLLRPKLFDFHGVSMTHFFTDNWDNIQNFKAKSDDVVVATYPKAGNLLK